MTRAAPKRFPLTKTTILTADSIVRIAKRDGYQRMVRNAAWYGMTGREMGNFLNRNQDQWQPSQEISA